MCVGGGAFPKSAFFGARVLCASFEEMWGGGGGVGVSSPFKTAHAKHSYEEAYESWWAGALSQMVGGQKPQAKCVPHLQIVC